MFKNSKNYIHKRNILIFTLSLIFLTTIDQIIKLLIEKNFVLSKSVTYIPNILKITYLKNYGAAFGILLNMRTFLIIMTILILFFLFWFIFKFKISKFYYLFAFSMLISGGIGNLFDRIFRGYVVDYFDLVFWPLNHFAVFNLADCLTTTGYFMIFLKVLFSDAEFEKFMNKFLKKDHQNFNELNKKN